MKMLQYVNILKGFIFLKIPVQFEKLVPGFQVHIILRCLSLCISTNFTTNLSCKLYALSPLMMYLHSDENVFYKSCVRNKPHNLNIKYLSQIILPVLKIRLRYKEY